jgi:hypothetical protein
VRGQIPEKRDLVWLLNFVALDLEHERSHARRWRALQYAIHHFPLRGGGVQLEDEQVRGGPEEAISYALAANLQADAAEMLRRRIERQGYTLRPSELGGRFWWRFTEGAATLCGEFVPLFKLRIGQLLTSHGKWLRRCKSDSCASPAFLHLFVAHKAGLYCSETCADRETMRRYRNKQRKNSRARAMKDSS